ncbi:hypothetical protein LB534_18435 [Mesorhizobium sp. CA18]|uniref:hypothetical protein n=1 Tax=unclassified Mesorhizobium TaxID=325217 RepID=UPI001CCCF10D|nr:MULTISPECIES: hypothetical protein [unclassified Mesorhizobium]MBZ9736896.1 hypothetical protein [Mesorhizobium sp. CA9]MBZ9827267.1 hypothetical protein [Mesorhizobium sp. CA18]MBZ9832708.1 hypothetical protein [Mesorhizobium sp. CA2]MBZ9838985.1 hypothetical protein [Mesorhizobium sp. CA3]MBZ9879438.1 hypothetical protein [Mesorhizobium sp. Ca11]
MKTLLLASVIAIASAFAVIGPANAGRLEFGIGIGDGYYDDDYRPYYGDDYYIDRYMYRPYYHQYYSYRPHYYRNYYFRHHRRCQVEYVRHWRHHHRVYEAIRVCRY